METIIKKVSELIPYINNPRNNDEAVDAVASSIKNFGFKVPIVVDSNNEIINGHTRLKAAQKLGLETVPVIVADDLTPEQVKAFRLADNKVGEIATWNDEMLAIELGELAEIDFDMMEFGFEIEEEKEVIEDEAFDTTPPEEPTSKLGDIYQLGRHRLMVGDSTDCEQVKALMGEQQADLLLTDPPYNVAYQGKTEDALTIENDSKSAADFHLFLVDVFEAAKSVMKKGAAFYCWYASSEVVNFHTSIEETGFMVKQELIWNKNSMVLGRQDYQWKHEPCLYGWLEGASHSWYSGRNQTTVLNFDKPQRNGDHPTMKPVALFDYQMQNSSKQGDIVLDLFGGSGATMVAAEQNGRNAYLMEFDPRYADVIIRRWEELTGEKAVKIN
ncbi:DNA modification methylase [Lactococcus lactis]|uniref:DNA modification methylase n=1 Tax=Lactococcus lactis TaxID=1358 RepID=UPI002FC62F6C